MLVRVERADKLDNESLSMDCSGSSETALYRIRRRTTENELLRMLQQVQGPKGFAMRHQVV